jgi:hypothetical protein
MSDNVVTGARPETERDPQRAAIVVYARDVVADLEAKETAFYDQFKISSWDHRRRCTLFLSPITGKDGKIAREADRLLPGSRVAIYEKGGNLSFKKVDSAEALKKLLPDHLLAAKEAFPGDSFSYGEWEDSAQTSVRPTSPNDEFTPIIGGGISKQLYLTNYLTMHARCFYEKNHNPLARAIVDIYTSYCIGKGVKLRFNSPTVERYVTAFTKSFRWQQFQRDLSDTLCWAGEIFIRYTPAYGVFMPSFELLDPSTVWEIVTEPANIENVKYYHRQYPTQYQMTYKPNDKASDYIYEDIDPARIIHRKINAVPGEKRGRSDLFCVLAWLKWIRDFYGARITKAQLHASMVWDWEIDGDPDDVGGFSDQSSDQNKMLPYGTNVFHSSNTKLNAVDAKGSDTGASDNIGEALVGKVAVGVGLSPEQLGVGGQASTRATALTKEAPAMRRLEMRQTVLEEILREVIDVSVSDGKRTGAIPPNEQNDTTLSSVFAALRKMDLIGAVRMITAMLSGAVAPQPTDCEYEVIFSELVAEDRDAKIKRIMTEETAGYLDKQTAAEMCAAEERITNYDYDKVRERINEQQQDQLEALYALQPQTSSIAGAPTAAPAPGSAADNARYREQAGQAK